MQFSNVWKNVAELNDAVTNNTVDNHILDKNHIKRLVTLQSKCMGFYRYEHGVLLVPLVLSVTQLSSENKIIKKRVACNSKWMLVEVTAQAAIVYFDRFVRADIMLKHFGKLLLAQYHAHSAGVVIRHCANMGERIVEVEDLEIDGQEVHIPKFWQLTKPLGVVSIDGISIKQYLTQLCPETTVLQYKITDALSQYLFKTEAALPSKLIKQLTLHWTAQHVDFIRSYKLNGTSES